MAYRNETYTIGRTASKPFLSCRRSDVTPLMVLRYAAIYMAVKS
jgi:hypothetical protein